MAYLNETFNFKLPWIFSAKENLGSYIKSICISDFLE